jgi:hypothetical protein
MKVTSSGCGVGVRVAGRVIVDVGEEVFVRVAAVVPEGIGANKVSDGFTGASVENVFAGDTAGKLQAASRKIDRISSAIRLMVYLPRVCDYHVVPDIDDDTIPSHARSNNSQTLDNLL